MQLSDPLWVGISLSSGQIVVGVTMDFRAWMRAPDEVGGLGWRALRMHARGAVQLRSSLSPFSWSGFRRSGGMEVFPGETVLMWVTRCWRAFVLVRSWRAQADRSVAVVHASSPVFSRYLVPLLELVRALRFGWLHVVGAEWGYARDLRAGWGSG